MVIDIFLFHTLKNTQIALPGELNFDNILMKSNV